jgi:hypothetical protein
MHEGLFGGDQIGGPEADRIEDIFRASGLYAAKFGSSLTVMRSMARLSIPSISHTKAVW